MTRIGQILLGVLTTGLFLFVAVSLLMSERWFWGFLVLALGLLRGFVLVRQLMALREAEE